MNINIIVAYCKNNGIGFENQMPWHIKSDLKKFKNLTIGNNNNAIIMGKNTYNSILNINKNGLLNRDNLILSTTINIDKTNESNNIIKSFNNIQNLENFIKTKNYDNIWIIGGEKIYNYFLNKYPDDGLLKPQSVYVTYINKEFKCDTFFPKLDNTKYKFISQELHNNDTKINDHNIVHNIDHNIFDIVYSKINDISVINDHNMGYQ